MKRKQGRMPKSLRERFINGYDGSVSGASYTRSFVEEVGIEEIGVTEDTLLRIAWKIKKDKKAEPKSNTDYKALDAGKVWTYHEDLLKVANSMGCKYITEAVAKMHSEGAYAPDIAKKFERGRNWPLRIMEYIGIEKKPRGGTAHHGRNK